MKRGLFESNRIKYSKVKHKNIKMMYEIFVDSFCILQYDTKS